MSRNLTSQTTTISYYLRDVFGVKSAGRRLSMSYSHVRVLSSTIHIIYIIYRYSVMTYQLTYRNIFQIHWMICDIPKKNGKCSWRSDERKQCASTKVYPFFLSFLCKVNIELKAMGSWNNANENPFLQNYKFYFLFLWLNATLNIPYTVFVSIEKSFHFKWNLWKRKVWEIEMKCGEHDIQLISFAMKINNYCESHEVKIT